MPILDIAILSGCGPSAGFRSAQGPTEEYQERNEDGPQNDQIPERLFQPLDHRARQRAEDHKEAAHEDLELFLAQESSDGFHDRRRAREARARAPGTPAEGTSLP